MTAELEVLASSGHATAQGALNAMASGKLTAQQIAASGWLFGITVAGTGGLLSVFGSSGDDEGARDQQLRREYRTYVNETQSDISFEDWKSKVASKVERTTIDMGKEGKHIPGHNNYLAGRSILISDPAELARAAGAGERVGDVPVGQPGSKERESSTVTSSGFTSMYKGRSEIRAWASFTIRRRASTSFRLRRRKAMNELRSRVLLSAQRALLGEVFPALRAVTVRWSKDTIELRAYVDGELLDDDAESLSCVATELTADLWQEMRVDHGAIRCDWPQPIVDDDGVFIYARREQT